MKFYPNPPLPTNVGIQRYFIRNVHVEKLQRAKAQQEGCSHNVQKSFEINIKVGMYAHIKKKSLSSTTNTKYKVH